MFLLLPKHAAIPAFPSRKDLNAEPNTLGFPVIAMSIPLDIVEKLSYHENIVGLKDSERDEKRLEEIFARIL